MSLLNDYIEWTDELYHMYGHFEPDRSKIIELADKFLEELIKDGRVRMRPEKLEEPFYPHLMHFDVWLNARVTEFADSYMTKRFKHPEVPEKMVPPMRAQVAGILKTLYAKLFCRGYIQKYMAKKNQQHEMVNT